MEISFEKYNDGKWYVVFPEYEGPQADLEMVEGADKLLVNLTDDNLYVNLEVSTKPYYFTYSTLELTSHDDYGAYYKVLDCPWYEGYIWLCNLIHNFFEEH